MRPFLIVAMCLMVAPASSQEPPIEPADLLAQQEMLQQQIWQKGEKFRQQENDVKARLAEACGNLYSSEPDRTITNPLCYDVFLNLGLPD